MIVRAELLEQLVAAIADAVAARLAPECPVRPVEEAWRLLTLEETAERLTRSTRWVRQRAKDGLLPFVRLDGGALAFDPDDVRAFADSRRVAADGAQALAGRLHRLGDPASGAGSRARDRAEDPRVARRAAR